jgi:predicted  nucleic acid-binding Zn-ribbon protein
LQTPIYDLLNELKTIDDHIKQLTVKKISKPRLLMETRQKLTVVENKLKSKTEQLELENRRKKQLSDIVSQEKEKLAKSEQKLASVKNNKEYQAVQKEITQFKKNIKNLEEQEKNRIEALAIIEKEFQEIESEFNSVNKEHESVLIKVKDEINSIERDLNDAKEKKNKSLSSLPEELKKRYTKIYENKDGIGISVIQENRCSVCNIALPRQLCNDILKGDRVFHCPSCQRVIIYIKNN